MSSCRADAATIPLQVARLAVKDLWHQRLSSLVLILALAAVLAPLLVLFGLKFGVVDKLVQGLVEDPANREIRLVGHGRFDRGWLTRMAAREDIAFVVPRTRGAAASIDLRLEGGDKAHASVELVPSGPGDPLLQGYAKPPGDIGSAVISARTARRLGARVGDRLKASVRRRMQGRWSRVQAPLRVVGIVPDSRFARHGAFVVPELLTAVEDYRDGYAVPKLGWGEGDAFTGTRYHSGFRMYVRGLDDVTPVRDLLSAEGRGFELSTRAKAIEEVKRLDRYLTSTFWIIALIGSTGYLLSFAAAMWVNVERRRRDLSVLQLLGFRAGEITLFPVVQSAVIALGGGLLAIGLFRLIAWLINGYFAREAGQLDGLCRLLPSHLGLALSATLLCGIASSGLAAFRTTRIEASKGLREL